MPSPKNHPPKAERASDPRWAAMLALLATGGLYYALPERLAAGPNWLLLAVIVLLLIPTVVARRAGYSRMHFVLGLLLSGLVTAAVIWSLGMLTGGLLEKSESPTELLRGAAALWCSNVLIFASWYWRLDAGGPTLRENRAVHVQGDFLFPQMLLPPALAANYKRWKPGFIDYLFLAFNASTAFSPTDVPVLSRWAKVLMMVQSMISLGTIALLAARAVNIL